MGTRQCLNTELRNNSKLDLLKGRFKRCLTIFSWSASLKWRDHCYRQLRNYANRCNVHVRQIRQIRDRLNPLEDYGDEDFRLHFCLTKDSVSDLVKIVDKDLQHKTRRGLPLVVGKRGFWANQKSTKKYALNKLNKIQQTFPSFPHKLKLFSTAKLNTPQICQLIWADDELFEFV